MVAYQINLLLYFFEIDFLMPFPRLLITSKKQTGIFKDTRLKKCQHSLKYWHIQFHQNRITSYTLLRILLKVSLGRIAFETKSSFGW